MCRSTEEDVSVNALIQDETICRTQRAMSELFGVNKSTINRHLKNIFQEGELNEKVVIAEIATTTQHGGMAERTHKNRLSFIYNGNWAF
jgi:hypothetical protein